MAGIVALRAFGAFLRAILGPSWGFLGPSWGLLGAILEPLGASWHFLGPPWGNLGPSWGHLGRSCGHLGAILGPKIAPQRPPRGQDCPTKAPNRHQDAAQTSYGASRRLCYRCYVGCAESSLRSHKNRPPSEPSSHHVAAMLRLCRLISHNLFHLQPC